MSKPNIPNSVSAEKYDELLAISEQFGLVQSPPAKSGSDPALREQAILRVGSLFPSFTPDDQSNDELINSYFLEQYGYYRSLGLSVQDTAYNLELSHYKMQQLLDGVGISVENFTLLAKAELFARAQCKARLLKHVEQASNSKQWRTSLTLLEKMYPDEYDNKGGIEKKLDELVERKWEINIVDPVVKALEEE